MKPWRVAAAVEALARLGMTQPIGSPVASDDAFFLADKGARHVAARVLRQRLGLAASGQAALQVERWDAAWRRAVWFHAEAPQLGDTLMDLAPRSLLAAHGIALDVVAPRATVVLLRGDRWLHRVLDDPRQVDASACDVVIVDRNDWRALAIKRAVAPRLPWLSVRGDYLAYDYHRALFATRRIAAWLGVSLDATDEARHARQKLEAVAGSGESTDAARRTATRAAPARDVEPRCAAQSPPSTAPSGAATAARAADGRPCFALALGAVQPERRYDAWPAVAAALARAVGPCRFVLLGSDNGLADAVAVQAGLRGHRDVEVLNRISRTDLPGARDAIAQADVLLCADGGLMHLGCTTETPVVALFDASVDPAWRLPLPASGFRGTALRAPQRQVSAITPDAVVEQALAWRR